MKHRLKKCKRCNLYTLKEKCPRCGNHTTTAHPAPFSPDDRYLVYKIKSMLKRS